MSPAPIALQDVSRWFGNVVAVNNISFDVGPGITGLLGPNGAGKSTVLHMLSGFLRPSSGEVLIDGKSAWLNPGMYRRVGLDAVKARRMARRSPHRHEIQIAGSSMAMS